MGTRTELPWNDIAKEVQYAVDQEMPNLKFISVNRLVDQITQNPGEYGSLGILPEKTMKCRCTHVMRHKFGWVTYTKGNGRGPVFVKPCEKKEKNVMEPNDEKYPVKVLRNKS